MTKTITISTKDRRLGMAVGLAPLLLLVSLGLFQRPIIYSNILTALVYLLPFIAFWYALLYHSYISIDEVSLHVVKLLVIRDTVPITGITALRHRYSFAGAIQGIEVYYRNVRGRIKHVKLGIGAFGMRQVRPILQQIVQQNPSIEIDHKTQKLLQPPK